MAQYIQQSHCLVCPLILATLLVTFGLVSSFKRPTTTVKQWNECRQTVIQQELASSLYCLQSDDYKTVKEEFEELIQDTEICQKYLLLEDSEDINTGHFFKDCYLSLAVKAVAQQNSCFYNNHYAPIWIFCSNLETINDISFDIFNQCTRSQLAYNKAGSVCDQQIANALYAETFTLIASREITSCEDFSEYSKEEGLGSMINFEDYYKECILSRKMKKLASKDECFYNNYFRKIFVDCARIEDD